MKCHDCGARLQKKITDLPFKISDSSIVIFKKLPVLQCENCAQFLMEDPTMERVDQLLEKIDQAAELEILSYGVASGSEARVHEGL